MKVTDILHRRQQNWQELARLTTRLETTRRSKIAAAEVARFASLYRAACADLAVADALPPNVVQYLHRLVGRAHNQLYRARRFDYSKWVHVLFEVVPQRVFQDRCVQLSFVLFWGMFITCGVRAYLDRQWVEDLLPPGTLPYMQEMHSSEPGSGSPVGSPLAVAFYIRHNTSIGLQCFAGGLLILPGLLVNMFNAGHLGAVFGYMARSDVEESGNFFNFVTAHGPFELTAIVLSAGAGLRLGMAWIVGDNRKEEVRPVQDDVALSTGMSVAASMMTAGVAVILTRGAARKQAAKDAMPIMGSAILMFFMAALIEGFLSPSAAPYAVKAGVAVASSLFLIFYFVVLGFPRHLL